MRQRYHDLAFTPAVKAVQEELGSRAGYARPLGQDTPEGEIGASEAQFMARMDSFYMASVSETGWPYVQHRGGPQGFVKVLDGRTIGFADFRGNRQYISVGNLLNNARVSLLFMDYPNRARLKLMGRAKLIGSDAGDLLQQLETPGYRAKVERGLVISVEAFDWNCPQHITQRFTLSEIEAAMAPLHQRIAELEAQLSSKAS